MNLSKKDYIKLLNYYKINYNEKLPINLLRKTTEKIIAKKICSCIKKVKNNDANKNEPRAIAICNNSVVLRKNMKIYSFSCKKSPILKSLKNHNSNKPKMYKISKNLYLVMKKSPTKKYTKKNAKNTRKSKNKHY